MNEMFDYADSIFNVFLKENNYSFGIYDDFEECYDNGKGLIENLDKVDFNVHTYGLHEDFPIEEGHRDFKYIEYEYKDCLRTGKWKLISHFNDTLIINYNNGLKNGLVMFSQAVDYLTNAENAEKVKAQYRKGKQLYISNSKSKLMNYWDTDNKKYEAIHKEYSDDNLGISSLSDGIYLIEPGDNNINHDELPNGTDGYVYGQIMTGKPVGEWLYFDDNGSIKEKFIKGVIGIHGFYEPCYEDGIFTKSFIDKQNNLDDNSPLKNVDSIRYSYKNCKREGTWTIWNNDGSIEEKNYKNGKLDGAQKFWFDENKKQVFRGLRITKKEINYKDGFLNGKATWHVNNRKVIECFYEMGNGSEIFQWSHPNKNSFKIPISTDGLKNGKFAAYPLEENYFDEITFNDNEWYADVYNHSGLKHGFSGKNDYLEIYNWHYPEENKGLLATLSFKDGFLTVHTKKMTI